MRVTFVRTVGARDRVYVARDDGSETSWQFPSYGDELPHDLVHLIVEAALGVRRGVWARVAAGADLGRINDLANRRGGRDKYAAAGMGDEPEQLLLAEALANLPWTRLELAPGVDDLVAQAPAGVSTEAFAAVRARLLALRDEWRALVPRGALTFSWP